MTARGKITREAPASGAASAPALGHLAGRGGMPSAYPCPGWRGNAREMNMVTKNEVKDDEVKEGEVKDDEVETPPDFGPHPPGASVVADGS
jgi:hypothetical protein